MQSNGQIAAKNWSHSTKYLVSAALLWHCCAQLLATYNAVPPRSRLCESLEQPFTPYIQLAKLSQGYRFFAPNPGPSHLLESQVFDQQGKPLELSEFTFSGDRTIGRLPPAELRVSLFSFQPRLLYHRYFMLTEQLSQFDPFEFPPQTQQHQWKLRHFQTVTDSYAVEILRRTGGAKVRMSYLVHLIPDPQDVRQGMPLDAAPLYQINPLGSWEYPRADEVIGPQQPEVIPAAP